MTHRRIAGGTHEEKWILSFLTCDSRNNGLLVVGGEGRWAGRMRYARGGGEGGGGGGLGRGR